MGDKLIEYLQLYTRNGVDLSCQLSNGDTLLHRSVRRQRIDAIEYLLDHGVSLHITDSNGAQPIHHVDHGSVAWVLSSGAQLYSVDPHEGHHIIAGLYKVNYLSQGMVDFAVGHIS